MSASSNRETVDIWIRRIDWLARVTGMLPAVTTPGNDDPAKPAESGPVLVPNDIETMEPNNAQADAFHQLLQAYSVRSDEEGRDFLLLLALKSSSLPSGRSLPALHAFLEVVPKRPVEERAALLTALATQATRLGMREQGSHVDRLAALAAIEQTTYAHLVDPDQQAPVVKAIIDGYVEVNQGDAGRPQDATDIAVAPVADNVPIIERDSEPPTRVEAPETVPLTPQEIQNMPRGPEKAAAFHRALEANSAKPDAEGREELLDLAKTVGWLHTGDCLDGLKAVLKSVEKRPPEERPALLVALTNQLGSFPPQEGDFPEPTVDQVAALEAILQTASDHLEPQQRSGVLDELRETLGGACGGVDFYMGELTVEAAVDKAKTEKTADMSSFLERLNVLSTQTETPETVPFSSQELRNA